MVYLPRFEATVAECSLFNDVSSDLRGHWLCASVCGVVALFAECALRGGLRDRAEVVP